MEVELPKTTSTAVEQPKTTTPGGAETIDTLSNKSELRDELGELRRIGSAMMLAFSESDSYDSDSLSSITTLTMSNLNETDAVGGRRSSTTLVITGCCSIFFLLAVVLVTVGISTNEQLNMSQLAARSLCLQLIKLPKGSPGMISQRKFASEVNRDDYGFYPDPLEAATGSEKKMMLARLAGDDRYEPKIFYRGENTSKDNPNLIPSHYPDRLIACTCEPDAHYLNLTWIRKGTPARCECGHWFKVIDADPNSY